MIFIFHKNIPSWSPKRGADEIVAGVRGAVEQGRQAYWVCPRMGVGKTSTLQTALDTHATLSGAEAFVLS